MRLASHDPVCDPSLRKWGYTPTVLPEQVFQRSPPIQHMEAQSLCNERQEHDGCDIHCSEGYEVATSTRIHQHPVISDHVPQARLELRWSRPTRPEVQSTWLRALTLRWRRMGLSLGARSRRRRVLKAQLRF